MLAQDITSYQPSMIEAKVESYIAKLLADKEVLLNLEASPNPAIASDARSLMATQLYLEGQLPDMVTKAKGITAGTYQYADLFAVYEYATKLNKHLNNVSNLQKQAGAVPTYITPAVSGETIFGLPKTTVYLFGGVLVIGLVGWYIWQK